IPNNVILDEVKDLSGSTTVNRLGDLEMFHFVQHGNQLIPNNVILNEVKDLSGSTTVNRHGDLEMFHFVQHDSV
ncbi:MAG: hypothetical protein J6Q21_05410, partial [Alistipes sp.]|nr:hypothetical protein [Alistipes sp.]